ncbi:MAG: tetratricopeptide repeat-containing sensor histidine kinase [Candidatus Cloacimonetes bacterium]|nr:tetratricopeptide repeat-containing sensor histidine kinase [Candidatus Cloacimonadota bacterium]
MKKDEKIAKLKKKLLISNDKEKYQILTELSDSYCHISLKKSREYIKQAIAYAKKLKDDEKLVSSIFKLSVICSNEGNYEIALNNLTAAQRLYQKMNNQKGIASCLRLMGTIYGQIDNYKKALSYSMNALEKENSFYPKNDFIIAGILNNIGIIYKYLKNYEKSLEYHFKALNIREKIEKEIEMASSFNNIGVVYEVMGNEKKALEYFMKSFKIKEKRDDFLGLANTCLNIGNQYTKLQSYSNAEHYLDKGLTFAEQLGSELKMGNLHLKLFELFYIQKRYGEAIEHHIRYSELKDKIFNIELNKKLAEIEAKHQIEKKEQQAEIYRLRNIELKNANDSKDKFFSIIAHDLRSPFSSLISFINIMKRAIDHYDKIKIMALVDELDISVKNAFNLLKNLLDWSRMQSGVMDFKPKIFDINSLIDKVVTQKKQTAEQKNIELKTNISRLKLYVLADKNMIETVLRNLLNNAIKFTNPKGNIVISSKNLENQVEVSIKDTGVGIKSENLNKLFKIESNFSTYGTSNEKGTGLGLILCKEFIEKNNGTLNVESEFERGSNFYFYLPEKPVI